MHIARSFLLILSSVVSIGQTDLILALATGLLTGFAVHSSATVNDAVAASIVYFYPLIQYVVTFGPILQDLGANKFEKQVRLSSADQQVVQIANVDTVYTRAVIDLSMHDLVLTIPEVEPVRGVVYPFHDLYGNNFANLGSFSEANAGKYLLRLAREHDPPLQLLNHDDANYTGIVNFPTTYGAMFPRILVFNQSGDPDEIARIQDIENSITLEPIARQRDCHMQFTPLTVEMLQNNSLAKAGALGAQQLNEGNITLLMDLATRLAPYNLPVSNPDNAAVLQNLTDAGAMLGEGWRQPDAFNLTVVRQIANSTIFSARSDPQVSNVSPGGVWTGWSQSVLGNFRRNYAVRAFISGSLGYLAITTDVNFPRNPVGNPLVIGPDECLILSFERKPPLQEPAGFWSLTAYGADRYLVPNQLDRYSLGDRSMMTFENGPLLYGDGMDADGPFQILVQPSHVPPPANWTSNWLPAPEGGGPVYLFLRFYGPTDELTNGSYFLPPDTKARPAIRA